MTITSDYVREVFKGLEHGDGDAFFAHVADNVDWTVMGTHPLAGHYHSKEDFIAGTFAKLGSRPARVGFQRDPPSAASARSRSRSSRLTTLP